MKIIMRFKAIAFLAAGALIFLTSPAIHAEWPVPAGHYLGIVAGGGFQEVQVHFPSTNPTGPFANTDTFLAALQYSYTFDGGEYQLGVYGFYELSHFLNWADGKKDNPWPPRYEHCWQIPDGKVQNPSGCYPDYRSHIWGSTLYFGYTGYKYIGVRVGIGYYGAADWDNGWNIFPDIVIPAAELTIGHMGYAYLAARFKMPNMAHGYDYLGAEIVVPAIKQAAIATGVNWDPKKQIGVHASAKIRITKMISIPLMANVYVRTSKEEFLNHDYSTGKQYVENSKEGYRGFDVMAGIEVFFPASDD